LVMSMQLLRLLHLRKWNRLELEVFCVRSLDVDKD